MISYLTRYLAGEYAQVWDELIALGTLVREEPLYTDALAVANETMQRAAHNCQMIVGRLKDSRYWFKIYSSNAYRPPHLNTLTQISIVEQQVGPLPLSIRMWYEICGEINLSGSHPIWPVCGDAYTCAKIFRRGNELIGSIMQVVEEANDEDERVAYLYEVCCNTIADPNKHPERMSQILGIITNSDLDRDAMIEQLQRFSWSIDPESAVQSGFALSVKPELAVFFIGSVEEYLRREAKPVVDIEPLMVYPIDPTYVSLTSFKTLNVTTGKAYLSGTKVIGLNKDNVNDDDYALVLDDFGADTWCMNLSSEQEMWETFVQYLRRSFQWGGFPGFANVDESLRPTEMLKELTEGLLPI